MEKRSTSDTSRGTTFNTYRYIRGRSLSKERDEVSTETTSYERHTLLTPDETTQEHIREEPLTGDTTTVTNTSILLRMERVEQSASDQVHGPDHRRWSDQETTHDTTDGKANELSRHYDKPLVREVVRLVVVYSLDGNDISCVCRASTDRGHDLVIT